MTATAPISACPACAAAPLAQSVASAHSAPANIVLSLPGIHCAGCISGVERILNAQPGVSEARVNLSLKRVRISARNLEAEALADILTTAGYEAFPLDTDMLAATQTDPKGRALMLRLAVAGFAMMNVMLFSVAVWSGASAATQIMFHWISAAIAVPALMFSAQVFAASAWTALRAGRLNMDVPITLAIILAACLSVFETAQGGTHVYFDAALSLTFFLLIGRYLDHRTRMAARSASQELSALEVPKAVRVRDGIRETVHISQLSIGDEIVVPAGMRIPVDGIVQTGMSELDRSLLTGESMAVGVKIGDVLAAGELNLSAPLTVEVTAIGEDTSLRRMAALVDAAEGTRNRYTALADRAAQIYAPAVHLLALLTFIGWIIASSDVAHSLNIAISVLIITCPCALGLAVPAVMTAASGRFFRHGLLVKDATALERLAEVDTIIFDKTGTLTNGRATLDTEQLTPEELGVLSALSQSSNHPVSQAIAAAIPAGIGSLPLWDIREVTGRGVEAVWEGQTVRLGHGDWVGTASSPAFSIGGFPAKPLAFSETLRDGAKDTVQALQQMGYPVQIFSGDSQAATTRIAQQLGDVTATGQMTPAEKQAAIVALADAGKRVLMIGDGLNDTAALSQAHASVSPASALDASRAASDIVVLGKSLSEIPDAIQTATAARRRVLENFAIAAGYNMIAIPIAVLGFATPLSAAIAMSASSITVLLNALRVR